VSFHFEVIPHWAHHEELSSVSTNQNFSLIKPSMSRKVAGLRQLLDLFIGLKGVVLDLEQPEYIAPSTADEMRLRRTDGDRVCPLYGKVANCQSSTATDIQEHKLIIRISSHAACILGLRWRKCNYLK
jgi:hypothetical protein